MFSKEQGIQCDLHSIIKEEQEEMRSEANGTRSCKGLGSGYWDFVFCSGVM